MLLYIYIVRLFKRPTTNEKTNTVISLTDGQNTDGTIQNNSHPTTNNKPASGQFKKPHKNNNSSADGRRTKFLIKTTFAEKKVEKGVFFFSFYFLLFFFKGTERDLFHRHFENTCGTDTKTPGIYGGF